MTWNVGRTRAIDVETRKCSRIFAYFELVSVRATVDFKGDVYVSGPHFIASPILAPHKTPQNKV